jgi:hypothetical protein
MTTGGSTVPVPADECYWAVFDPSAVMPTPKPTHRLTARTRERLGYLAEPQLPRPVDRLHAAFVSLDAKRMAACLMPRDRLSQLRDEGAESVVPAELPAFLAEEAADSAQFELLTGEFRPHSTVRRDRRNGYTAATAVLLIGAFTSFGFMQRAQTYQRGSQAIRAEITAALNDALPASRSSRLPAAARLTQELRRLRDTRSSDDDTSTTETSDASVLLADLLAHWPGTIEARTERLSMGDDRATLQVLVDEPAGVEALLAAWRDAAGWRVPTHSLDRERTRTGETLRLRAELVASALDREDSQ